MDIKSLKNVVVVFKSKIACTNHVVDLIIKSYQSGEAFKKKFKTWHYQEQDSKIDKRTRRNVAANRPTAT